MVTEVIPVSAEQSETKDNDEGNYGAGKAIDMLLETRSFSVAGSDGKNWLKLTLGKVYCLDKVSWYRNDGTSYLTWTCTKDDCGTCDVGMGCGHIILTVSTEGTVPDLPSFSDCRYGDTLEIKRTADEATEFFVFELAVIKKEGNVMSRIKIHNCSIEIIGLMVK